MMNFCIKAGGDCGVGLLRISIEMAAFSVLFSIEKAAISIENSTENGISIENRTANGHFDRKHSTENGHFDRNSTENGHFDRNAQYACPCTTCRCSLRHPS